MAEFESDEESANEQYKQLLRHSGTVIVQGLLSVDRSVDRLLGLLAQTMSNLNDAQSHFEDALTFCRKAGYRPELAWSLCDYADMLLERNNKSAHGEPVEPRAEEDVLRQAQGDRQKAMQLLDESLAISTELGMRPLMERVLSRREILKA